MPDKVKINVPLPSNGLTVDRPGEFIDARSAYGIKNMEYNRAIIRTRVGTDSLGSTLGERVQRYFELQIGNQTRLIRVGPTKVQAFNKTTLVWSDIHNAVLTGTAEDPVDFTFPLLSGAKIAVFTNGIDPVRKVSTVGNDANLGGSPPLVKFLKAFGPYLVLAYIVNDGSGNTFYSRVQWCDTGNPESWTPGGSSNAGSKDLLEDPEDITGVGLFGNFLTIHKPKSIYVGQLVSTSDVIQFDRKATGVGAVAAASIAAIPSGEEIFLASDGFHLFNGITAPLIDSPVQDEIREEMNPRYSFKAHAIFVEELDEYWCALPTGSDTEPRTVYKYNWRTKQMYKDDRANLSAMGLFLNTAEDTWDDRATLWDADGTRWSSIVNQSNNPVVIFGDADGNSTKRGTGSSDAGVAIESAWDTKDFTAEDFGAEDSDLMMRWTKLSVWAKGGSIKFYYSLDSGSTWTFIQANTLASDYPDDDAPLDVWFDVVKSKFRVRFFNNTLDSNFTLKKYLIEASLREARK